MYAFEPLPHFIDAYLGYLHETFPTQATFDGVHQHDDLIEDLSAVAIESHARDLGGYARRLEAIERGALSVAESIDRRILQSHIAGRLFEVEQVRAWERDPQHYADLLATSLAAQALFTYAPASERARRVVSKLRQAPRLLASARENVKDPPGIFVKVALETFKGVLTFIERDLPRAFAEIDDLHLLGDLDDASTEAGHAISGYIGYLENDLAPRSKASFRLGRERLEQKVRLEEGVTLSSDRLLAIAMRELRATQEEFRRVAGRLNGRDPLQAWQTAKADHPAPGQLVSAAREQLVELRTFIERNSIVSMPDGPAGSEVVVAPTPQFYRWTFASMWTPGPFESRPGRAYYYLTDVDAAWPDDRQEEHLREFSRAALWAISIHEVYPGHFLHYEHLRRVASPLWRSTLFAPLSYVEGWAHYCEQMMLDAGFGGRDDTLRLGQLAEALIRLARFVVGIRLHAEDLSVEQGVRFFREEAFMEEGSARREAERGTFDPGYILYSAGKLMLLKLREDYKAAQASKFSLRNFHDALLGAGTAPFWAVRQKLLGDDHGALIE